MNMVIPVGRIMCRWVPGRAGSRSLADHAGGIRRNLKNALSGATIRASARYPSIY